MARRRRPRLITIAFSHYNEKARWALDRCGIDYDESRYLPMFHFLPVALATAGRRAGRGDRVSTRFSTPVLITQTGELLCDSADIARYASDRAEPRDSLYPSPEVEELEQQFHDRLGPHTRRIAYNGGFADKRIVLDLARRNVGRAQTALMRVAYRGVYAALKRALNITPQAAERSWLKIFEQFEAVEARLRGGPYLVGDRFTAADLTFACMAAPVLLPSPEEGYGAVLPRPHDVPHRDVVERLRASAAGAFALRMFRQERGRARDGSVWTASG